MQVQATYSFYFLKDGLQGTALTRSRVCFAGFILLGIFNSLDTYFWGLDPDSRTDAEKESAGLFGPGGGVKGMQESP
jgi:hypothetical protein